MQRSFSCTHRFAAGLAFALAFAVPAADADERDGLPRLGTFGVALDNRDTATRPGDDFDRYANGAWRDRYRLRDDEAEHGAFRALAASTELQLRAIVEELLARKDLRPGSDEQRIRDLYLSHMDIAARDAAGIAPLRPILARIAAIDSRSALAAAFGRAGIDGTGAPVKASVNPDLGDPHRSVLELDIGGLGLPGSDLYLGDDPQAVDVRIAYHGHIVRMLGFAGVPADDVETRAEAVLYLEIDLARAHLASAEDGDTRPTCDPCSPEGLRERFPDYDWNAYFAGRGLDDPSSFGLSASSAIGPALDLVKRTPLPVWRDYLSFHAVRNHAPLLSTEIDDAAFAFTGTVLYGQKTQREAWSRGISLLEGLDDAVGRLYVARHFKPEARAVVDPLVEHLRRALRLHVQDLDWMRDTTRAEAMRKLESLVVRIGAPERSNDDAGVTIVADNPVANVVALRRSFVENANRRLRLGTDRDAWTLAPHAVSAYYDAPLNAITFPAGILQPPFFDPNADPAVNYGAIGAVMGHELTHALYGTGAGFDHAGVRRDWWTDEDRAGFDARTRALVAQYDGDCPLSEQCVDGQRTLGENIGDLGGLTLAYTAYRMSLEGKPAPVIDGLTGDQRFFLAWAQVWRSKSRDEATIRKLRAGPHPPAQYRINGPLRNLDAWYRAFDVKPGDKLYLPPEQRARIW